jgi:polyphosphate kinase
VDIFLEHSRIWYFYNKGKEDVFLSSADWMKRNLYRRIEVAFPVLDKKIKQTVIDILKIQLNDNVKACFIDEHLNNLFKYENQSTPVHAQQDIYKCLKMKDKDKDKDKLKEGV